MADLNGAVKEVDYSIILKFAVYYTEKNLQNHNICALKLGLTRGIVNTGVVYLTPA